MISNKKGVFLSRADFLCHRILQYKLMVPIFKLRKLSYYKPYKSQGRTLYVQQTSFICGNGRATKIRRVGLAIKLKGTIKAVP